MSDLRTRHDAVMGDGAPLFYDEPIELASGDGVWLEATDGTRYLDCYNNVPCVGHANPRVARAVADQAATLNVHSRYLHENVIAYSERLLGTHHDGIESIVITCSGTEANDVALGMARGATGKTGIIGTNATYHGNSPIIGSLTRLPAGSERAGFRSITNPCTFRRALPDANDDELLAHYLAELDATIAAADADGGFAGMIFCSILANEGLTQPPAGWFQAAVERVRAAGGLVIADEVQAGFARSGRMWGYETSGFEPDIVTMGKPMGNGMPVAAVAASHELVSGFRARNRYFNTYASSPLQAAAANAVLDEIADRGIVDQVATVGNRVLARLRELAADDPRMGDVRGQGLFLGVDWVVPGTTEPDEPGAGAIVEAVKERGVLMGKAGHHFNVIKVRPPLIFDDEHAAVFLDAFEGALAATAE